MPLRGIMRSREVAIAEKAGSDSRGRRLLDFLSRSDGVGGGCAFLIGEAISFNRETGKLWLRTNLRVKSSI